MTVLGAQWKNSLQFVRVPIASFISWKIKNGNLSNLHKLRHKESVDVKIYKKIKFKSKWKLKQAKNTNKRIYWRENKIKKCLIKMKNG